MEVINGIVLIDFCYPKTIKTLSHYADIEVRFVFDVTNVQ